MDAHSTHYTPADLARIRTESFVADVEFHREIASTNDRALELAAHAGRRLPLLVLAESQTAGRGRGANTWWAEGGALTFSVLLETAAAQLPTNRWPRVSLTVGLAVCEALEQLVEGHDVRLKWPNDVYLEGRKVCGVLLEVPRGRDDRLVLGIGINVNNSLREAPADLRETAAALCDVSKRSLSPADVLLDVLDRLADRLGWIGTRDDELTRRWRQRCLLTGRNVEIDQGTRRLVGVCRGIDEEGALLLDTEHGTERCFAGVVRSM